MKSVFRSAFDPLPRFPSARAQVLVAAVLVVGITISVLEYLESSTLARTPQVEAQDLRADPAAPRTPSREAARSTGRSGWTALRATQVPTGELPVPSSAGERAGASASKTAPMSAAPGEDG